jgi:hypothetical protein
MEPQLPDDAREASEPSGRELDALDARLPQLPLLDGPDTGGGNDCGVGPESV